MLRGDHRLKTIIAICVFLAFSAILMRSALRAQGGQKEETALPHDDVSLGDANRFHQLTKRMLVIPGMRIGYLGPLATERGRPGLPVEEDPQCLEWYVGLAESEDSLVRLLFHMTLHKAKPEGKSFPIKVRQQVYHVSVKAVKQGVDVDDNIFAGEEGEDIRPMSMKQLLGLAGQPVPD